MDTGICPIADMVFALIAGGKIILDAAFTGLSFYLTFIILGYKIKS